MQNVGMNKPGDHITARIFGQNLTMQRCEWEQLRDETIPGAELHERAKAVCAYDSDEPAAGTPAWRRTHGLEPLHGRDAA